MFVFQIGLPKTGTSTIQAFLAANVEALEERRVVFPALDRKRAKAQRHL